MIKHCVAWKVKEDKKENCETIKKTLEALPKHISLVKNLEVGINVHETPRSYDIILLSEFDSLEDLETYRVHPLHQEAVKIIRERVEGVVTVDFEG